MHNLINDVLMLAGVVILFFVLAGCVRNAVTFFTNGHCRLDSFKWQCYSEIKGISNRYAATQ
jgi:hypothetical protein